MVDGLSWVMEFFSQWDKLGLDIEIYKIAQPNLTHLYLIYF